eukprot:3624349-Rhodomonas_salina.1
MAGTGVPERPATSLARSDPGRYGCEFPGPVGLSEKAGPTVLARSGWLSRLVRRQVTYPPGLLQPQQCAWMSAS